MPDRGLPQMWTMGSGLSVMSCVALAGLFAAFFVVSLIRHLGGEALAFGALGALVMSALALLQWRLSKRHDADRRD